MSKKIKAFYLIFLITLISIYSPVQSKENKTLIALGNKSAKVTVKVFSSLTCPHCSNFHGKIFKKLKKEFIDTNLVKFEHHGFPLDLAALNAEKIMGCINKTEIKLKFLNELYEKQSVWAAGSDINSINSNLKKIAKKYGLNNDKVSGCLNSEELEEEILSNRIDVHKKYSIKSTPTILINENEYDGKHEYKALKKEIERFL